MASWDAREATAEARLARALGYPYPLPRNSYILREGAHRSCAPEDAPELRRNRTPVLAVGSNQSPQQLARKYPGAGWSPILCERCALTDFDTVYSAHITGYGSIAASLHPSPGTRVTLFVNWLDDAQLDRMHKTEIGVGNYAFARLSNIVLKTEFGHALDSVQFYVGQRGALRHDGTPVPLAEVPAENRAWTARTQRDVQHVVRARTAPDRDESDFILSAIADDALRAARRAALATDAIPFDHPGLETLIRSL